LAHCLIKWIAFCGISSLFPLILCLLMVNCNYQDEWETSSLFVYHYMWDIRQTKTIYCTASAAHTLAHYWLQCYKCNGKKNALDNVFVPNRLMIIIVFLSTIRLRVYELTIVLVYFYLPFLFLVICLNCKSYSSWTHDAILFMWLWGNMVMAKSSHWLWIFSP